MRPATGGLRAAVPAAVRAIAAGRPARVVRENLMGGRTDPAWWPSACQWLSTARALELLAGIPPIDRLVVCHGVHPSVRHDAMVMLFRKR
jgi:hypothetical protein